MVVNSHPLYQLSYPGICVFGRKSGWKNTTLNLFCQWVIYADTVVTMWPAIMLVLRSALQKPHPQRILSYFLALFQLHDD